MENFLILLFWSLFEENILTTARKYQLGDEDVFDLAKVNNYSFWISEVKLWNSPWKPPQSYPLFVQMGKLRSKEVSNDLLGPMGRWGLEWRVKANTWLSTHPISPSPPGVKGKGSFLRCRAEWREGRQTESSPFTSDHIHKEDSPCEWRFSSLSKSLYLTHHNSICTHLKWRLCTCALKHYLHNLLTILGAVSVLRLPSQLHQDLPGTVVFYLGDCFIKKQNTSGGQIPYWRRFLFTTAFWKWEMSPSLPHTPYPPSE